MRLETARALVDAMGDDFDEDELPSVHTNYSGREMDGTTTAGVVFSDLGTLLEAIAMVAAELGDRRGPEADDFCREVGRFRFDSMGRQQIAY